MCPVILSTIFVIITVLKDLLTTYTIKQGTYSSLIYNLLVFSKTLIQIPTIPTTAAAIVPTAVSASQFILSSVLSTTTYYLNSSGSSLNKSNNHGCGTYVKTISLSHPNVNT